MVIDGKKIVKYRAENRLSQEELAKRIGVKPLTIHRAEKGRCSMTTKILIEKEIKQEV